MKLLLILSTLVLAVSAAPNPTPNTHLKPRAGGARTSAPAGCVVVSKTPSSGQFKTVNEAIASLSTTATGTQCVFIFPGTYGEQVFIAKRSAQLTVYGYTNDSTRWDSNTVTITQGRSQSDQPSNDLTATLRAVAANLKIYNLNLVNTRGKGSQALAVSAQGTKQGYYACKFVGYQDTVLANEGVQVYAGSYIEGAVDFIFGQRARAWFTKCALRINGPGSITANGRPDSAGPSYYVITDSDVAVKPGSTVATGATYLGRPWRNWSRVVVQKTQMTDVVNAAGWSVWQPSQPQNDNVYYREYQNSGAGAATKGRVGWAGFLNAAIKIDEILGGDYQSWVDTAYL